jgi:predicted lipid-binding transport protein (Tim44 family)
LDFFKKEGRKEMLRDKDFGPRANRRTVTAVFLIDTMGTATGKMVSGDPAVPDQATEVWTFARRLGGAPGDWKLSAIQRA